MAYADLPTLLARAGRLAPAWTTTSDPDTADLLRMLEDIAAEIDAQLAAAGVTLPVSQATAAALAGVNADGVLVVAIPATFPQMGDTEMAILTEARARWERFLAAVTDGTYPAVRIIVTDAQPELVASSFWEKDVGYPYDTTLEWWQRPDLAPAVFRGERG